ncbi:unnamed protein product [Diatraea saccharalis]|uniref:Uncharacterized protein n=1 Tax=Diatraea saccharalis TaxID=40085 RepID=A0A9N9WHP9_9NEOP|nr:unnamed protein product [Diatraea saccharalis]
MRNARDLSVPMYVPKSKTTSLLPYHIRKIIQYKNYMCRLDNRLLNGYYKKHNRRKINQLCDQIRFQISKHLDTVWDKKLLKIDNPYSNLWKLFRSLKPKSTNLSS